MHCIYGGKRQKKGLSLSVTVKVFTETNKKKNHRNKDVKYPVFFQVFHFLLHNSNNIFWVLSFAHYNITVDSEQLKVISSFDTWSVSPGKITCMKNAFQHNSQHWQLSLPPVHNTMLSSKPVTLTSFHFTVSKQSHIRNTWRLHYFTSVSPDICTSAQSSFSSFPHAFCPFKLHAHTKQ